MDSRDGACIDVIVDQPGHGLARAFSYLPPKSGPERIHIGSYVLVPFGRRQMPGFVVGFRTQLPEFSLKRISSLLLDDPVFSERQLEEARWLALEYHCSLGDALRCYLPPGTTRNIRRRAVLLSDAPLGTLLQMIGGRSARQREVVETLRQAGGEMGLDALKSAIGADPTSALRTLEERGVAALKRDLAPPIASEKTRRYASLAVTPEAAEEEAAARAARAPRQAETLRALAAAGEALLASELNASAVSALARDGLIEVSEQAVRRAPDEAGLGEEASVDPEPTPEQAEALSVIGEALQAGGGEVLLHGVTGSGKTEVYIQAIRRALELRRTAIVLVPEISLTPQLLGRFRARFGDSLAVLHSAIGAGERFDEWRRAQSGEARIVVGARSAVFAPCPELGLVIIDEEHERAYKQDRPPRYDARTVASHRCADEGAVLVLGSATPSIETYWRFAEGHQGRRIADLPRRIDDRPLPEVEVVDMRREQKLDRTGTFSEALTAAIRDCLSAGNQAILFLNRRGFSTFVMCRDCGFSLRCPDCDVSMTYHFGDKTMRCHHCDRIERVPDICPSCEGTDIGFHGLGTERVADQVEREFPDARVCRMDRDTTSTKGAHGAILRRFASGQCNVLVGTQMIAKGLDLPNVTLVGVLNADTGLNRPDFRAAEHTFQLLAQVAGRAGRASKPGRVIVQSYNPDNYAIVHASGHDYAGFYEGELERRRAVRGSPYPPYGHLLAMHISDEDEDVASDRASRLGQSIRRLAAKAQDEVSIGGPAPAPLSKLRGRHRWIVVPRGPDRTALRELAIEALEELPPNDRAAVYIDVDPLDMM